LERSIKVSAPRAQSYAMKNNTYNTCPHTQSTYSRILLLIIIIIYTHNTQKEMEEDGRKKDLNVVVETQWLLFSDCFSYVFFFFCCCVLDPFVSRPLVCGHRKREIRWNRNHVVVVVVVDVVGAGAGECIALDSSFLFSSSLPARFILA
jgi:hypothetical protein